jgi:hypothetical protein
MREWGRAREREENPPVSYLIRLEAREGQRCEINPPVAFGARRGADEGKRTCPLASGGDGDGMIGIGGCVIGGSWIFLRRKILMNNWTASLNDWTDSRDTYPYGCAVLEEAKGARGSDDGGITERCRIY